MVGRVFSGGAGTTAEGEGGVPSRPVGAQSCPGLPCVRGGEDEEETAAVQRPRSALALLIFLE